MGLLGAQGHYRSAMAGISGVAYVLGRPVQLGAMSNSEGILAGTGTDPCGTPPSIGSPTFRLLEGAIMDAAVSSIQKTLAATSMQPVDVDALILCSSTVTQVVSAERHELAYLLRATDLGNAYPLGLTFATCANLPTALTTAAALIRQGTFKNILVVTFDRYSEASPTFVSQKSRFTSTCVLSDAVASCLVSSADAKAQYSLLHVSLASRAELMDDSTPPEIRVLAYLNLLRETCFDALCSCDVIKSQIRQVFVGNYFQSVVDNLQNALQLEQRQIFRDNISRTGHCYAADNLVNLRDYVDGSGQTPAEIFVLISTAVGQIGVSVLCVNS